MGTIQPSKSGFLGTSSTIYRQFDSAYQIETITPPNKPLIDLKITDDLMTLNQNGGRPGIKISKVNGIVAHYTAGGATSTAKNTRDYFENLNTGKYVEEIKSVDGKTLGKKIASCHYTIGQLGEVLRLIPDDEISYTSGGNSYIEQTKQKLMAGQVGIYPHQFVISYEACNSNADGRYTQACYDSQVKLCALLLTKFNLTTDNLYRHIDIVGTNNTDCPRWFNETVTAAGLANWNEFKEKVKAYL